MNVALKNTEPVTPEEFETMAKDERFNYELIDGVVMMSPSPSREHQRIANRTNYSILKALENTGCETLYELDIKYLDNTLKPDLIIFCDKDAELPEIVFEVLSPSTRQNDLLYKLVKYQEMGVKEYWIVDPKLKAVTIHDFVNDTADSYAIGDTIQSQARLEIVIAVADIFE